ncbi:MAG: hypothetical protein R3B90_19690 [Planctomycetaceae bacterium]
MALTFGIIQVDEQQFAGPQAGLLEVGLRQRDLRELAANARVLEVAARVLRQHGNCPLVLFQRQQGDGKPLPERILNGNRSTPS